ncbi:DEKNAAC105461 [Brettanomyces naardenensis]|uniref:DEKNAAC105461 n=1 Tax=Brettanomyces naardenensis TaxID=13370 RepID=A0A448YTH9_BRENA|nr:DEKNAAC105461 [Brettanomyces naardenensis]
MEVYNQFIDPSTCTSSLSCNFTSKDDQNLIVSKGTILQVYKLVQIGSSSPAESFNDDQFSFYDKQHKLALVSEYRLQGKIANITKFRSNDNPELDYLIVLSEFVKLSIVKWDPSTYAIRTTSLHYYESALKSLFIEKLSKIEKSNRTDPNGFCTSIESEGVFIFLPFYKEELEDELGNEKKQVKKIKEKKEDEEAVIEKDSVTPYFETSFIVTAQKLRDDLKNIMDYQYLYSYRNPTVAILYAPQTLSWAGFLPKAKDNMKVVVLSLDLEHRKASTIMELPNLPYDIDYIYPLPGPINGFLLIGSNEILHVNSLGSIRGVYTNNFFPDTSDLNLKDQSKLNLFCENSRVEYVGDDQVLLISELGDFYSLGFDESGGVSNLNTITKIDSDRFSNVSVNNVLQITNFKGTNSAFICCQGSDSVLINWKYNVEESSNNNQTVATSAIEDEDSWLYEKPDGEASEPAHIPLTSCTFSCMDKIINCGPVSDFTIGKISTNAKSFGLPNPNLNEDAIICTSGLEKDTCLSILNPSVKPVIKSTLKFSNASKIWTLNNVEDKTKYLITTDFKTYKTQIFQVDKNYKDLYTHDFDNKQYTVQFGTITTSPKEKLIVQVTPYKINVFTFKFRLVSSITYEREINAATISDNYVIAIMKNGEIDIFECDTDSKELKKLDLPALLNYLIFTYGWISSSSILNHVHDSKGVKRTNDDVSRLSEENPQKEITFWIVTADNRILVFKKDHKEKVYEFKDVHKFPETLLLSNMNPNYEADVDPTIKQAMFTTIGDEYHSKDYLLILTFGGEVLIYEIYFDPIGNSYKLAKGNNLFQFPVIGAPENSYGNATRVERNLFKLKDLNGCQSVLVTGATPFLIFRQHNSVPRMFKFAAKPILYFAPFNDVKCKKGLITIDDKKSCRICQLDSEFDYSNRTPIKKVLIGNTANKVEYESRSNTYVISTMIKVPYEATDEDGEKLLGLDPDKQSAFGFKSSVKLLTPENWSVIDTVELEDNEVCTSLKVMPLRVFETYNETKNFVVVGSGKYRVEDLSANGSWKMYEIIDVVPDPAHPEAKNKLKVITSENSKGAALGVCELAGRFSVIQGQRMLVRMIKKDNNAVPVAFTDTSLYAKDMKSFEDMMIIGDAVDGISLYGFDAEPYRMLRLGKEKSKLHITACDFIIHEGSLYIIVADEDSILHLLQYDPYDPESMRGLKLIRRSVFRFNGYTTSMVLKDRRHSIFTMIDTLNVPKGVDLGYETIGSNIDGSFYKVTPVNEYSYRRLYSLQNYISDKEVHWLGMNPKMNAIGYLSDVLQTVRRPFVDLNLILRYISLNEEKKAHFCKKLGRNALLETYKDVIGLQ